MRLISYHLTPEEHLWGPYGPSKRGPLLVGALRGPTGPPESGRRKADPSGGDTIERHLGPFSTWLPNGGPPWERLIGCPNLVPVRGPP